MANLLSFPARIPITADGQLASPEFMRFLMGTIIRMGGVSAPSIGDLDSQQYADAGIEETKAQLFALVNEFGSAPPRHEASPLDALTAEMHALRELVASLITEIDNIKAGITP
jgi:hypothetical protein